MKNLIILIFLMLNGQLYSQKTVLTDLDLSIESIQYQFNEIINSGGYYSNQSWNGDGGVHSTNFLHKTTTLNCINVMPHLGFRIPVIKSKLLDVGITPYAGLGYLTSLGKQTYFEYDEPYSPYEEEEAKIKHLSLDLGIKGHLRLDLWKAFHGNGYISIYGGYRLLKTTELFSMPVMGVEYSQEKWAVGVKAHFTEYLWYRELSNGDLETAKRVYHLGAISFHYLIATSKRERALDD